MKVNPMNPPTFAANVRETAAAGGPFPYDADAWQTEINIRRSMARVYIQAHVRHRLGTLPTIEESIPKREYVNGQIVRGVHLNSVVSQPAIEAIRETFAMTESDVQGLYPWEREELLAHIRAADYVDSMAHNIRNGHAHD